MRPREAERAKAGDGDTSGRHATRHAERSARTLAAEATKAGLTAAMAQRCPAGRRWRHARRRSTAAGESAGGPPAPPPGLAEQFDARGGAGPGRAFCALPGDPRRGSAARCCRWRNWGWRAGRAAGLESRGRAGRTSPRHVEMAGDALLGAVHSGRLPHGTQGRRRPRAACRPLARVRHRRTMGG